MKKYLPIIFTTFLTINVLTGCAGQVLLKQNNVSVQTGEDNDAAINQNATPISEAGLTVLSSNVSLNASASYTKLIAYKTKNYGQQSIADFNAMLASTPDELTEFLAAEADVINFISSDDENYDFFTTTMKFSSHELYCEHMGEEVTFFAGISKRSRPCDYLDQDGDIVYDFNCFADLQVHYSINFPELLTVSERDTTLLTFQKEMQNYLDSLSEDKIKNGNIKKKLIKKANKLAKNLSTKNMQLLSCEIPFVEII